MEMFQEGSEENAEPKNMTEITLNPRGVELARRLNCPLHKHEEQSSEPQHPLNNKV